MTRPHGVRGEIRVLEGTGCSGAWRQAGRVMLVGGAAEDAIREVKRVRGGSKYVILELDGVEDRDTAESLRGSDVLVEREVLEPLGEGLYYATDLIGLEVVDTAGRSLGRLREVFDNGAHEVYVVGEGDDEILLPVIDGVVIEVDPEAGRVVVAPPEGLPGLPG